MKSSIQGMKPIAELYMEFYGLKLSLLENGKIHVQAINSMTGKRVAECLGWIEANREHVASRLKQEGWS